jgi:carbamoyltransferase
MQYIRLCQDGTVAIPIFTQDQTLLEKETHAGVLRVLADQFGPARMPEEEVSQNHKDIAAALQSVLQVCQLHILRHFRRETGQTNLCLAGGVVLNCSANGVVRRSRLFDRVFVQPAAGDDGSALGAALYIHRRDAPATTVAGRTAPLWGPDFTDAEIRTALRSRIECRATRIEDDRLLCADIAERICAGQIVAWFQGRMEFGPRALGDRSILADPRDPTMRDRLNSLVKKREAFRPFAPVVTAEAASRFFDITPGEEGTFAHMLFVTQVRPPYRAQLPAITHVDGSARVQTVSMEDNPLLWRLLNAFGEITRLPILLNTSFNVRGQPIVCTPQEALDTFLLANLDVLVIGQYVVRPVAHGTPDNAREDVRETSPGGASPAT